MLTPTHPAEQFLYNCHRIIKQFSKFFFPSTDTGATVFGLFFSADHNMKTAAFVYLSLVFNYAIAWAFFVFLVRRSYGQ